MRHFPKRPSDAFLAAGGATAIILILFSSYALSSGAAKNIDIVFPEETESSFTVSSGSRLLTTQSVADVTIDIGNVKRVIASLVRPTSYYCQITNTLYYTGGSSTLYCIRYVQNDAERVDTIEADGAVRSSLLHTNETVYAWDAGNSRVYEGKWGDFNKDAAAMLPTYEDILDDTIVLLEAGRDDTVLEPCIRVVFEKDDYQCIYYISAAAGLLQSASFYKNDRLVRQVTVTERHIEPPDPTVFALPNGHSILEE